ncbi:MAG: transketolase [Leptospiraceae bacterium]|nr:transketolase [Leptospiraceae bacterium]
MKTSWEIGKPGDAELLQKINTLPKEELSEQHLRFLASRLRMNIVEMVYQANSGHPGGPLGLADIYTVLAYKIMNHKPSNPEWEQRDRLLISNGHVCAVRYSMMAMKGYFPETELSTFRQLGSRLQGHPSSKFLPMVENSSGSLGQGLSNAGGLALGLKLRKSDSRVFLGMSDGECQEGMTWEAAMAIAHRKVTNIHPFLDWNNIQIDGNVENVMALGDLQKKFESFGWEVTVKDGHNLQEIEEAFAWSLAAKDAPRMILFKTVLGKGVSFMENNPDWHGSPPKEKDRDEAFIQIMRERDSLSLAS